MIIDKKNKYYAGAEVLIEKGASENGFLIPDILYQV